MTSASDTLLRARSGELLNRYQLPILKEMARGQLLTAKLNRTSLLRQSKRNRIVRKLFGSLEDDPFYVQSPLHVELGCNIHVGKNFLCNFNVVLQDVAEIRIGDNVMLAPNVVITTALHPMGAGERRVRRIEGARFPADREINARGLPVTIGDDVWICAGAVICPGVTIGSGSVIGAGSVVTRDIPSGVLAVGVPCEVVRELPVYEKSRTSAFRVTDEIGRRGLKG